MSSILPPVIAMSFFIDGEPVEAFYELSKKKYDRPEPDKATTPRGIFLSSVMDRMHFLIPSNQAEANKAYYTPISDLLKLMWFKYFVQTKQKATNEEFQKKYKASGTAFARKHKYGQAAQDATVKLLTVTKRYMIDNELTHSDARSYFKVATSMIDQKDYIYMAEQQIAVRTQSNGS